MPEPTVTDKTVDDKNTDLEKNGDNGASDHSTDDNKNASVPLATFLGMKDTVKQLEGKLNEMVNAKKADAEAKLIEDGKLQELVDAKTLELSTKQAELEKAKTEAEESKHFKAAKVEEFKLKLGDKWNEEYANLSLTALDLLVSSMAGVKNVNVDNGSTGEHTEIELTAIQKSDAKAKYPFIDEKLAYQYHIDNLIKQGIIKEK